VLWSWPRPDRRGRELVACDKDAGLIGMTVAVAGPGSITGQTGSTGLGFAIPVDQAKPISDRLIAAGSAPAPPTGLPVGIDTD
jgi:putative serine protease PepD